jgi:hypothetical protein
MEVRTSVGELENAFAYSVRRFEAESAGSVAMEDELYTMVFVK